VEATITAQGLHSEASVKTGSYQANIEQREFVAVRAIRWPDGRPALALRRSDAEALLVWHGLEAMGPDQSGAV
jgi:hypothetical protein